jgi:hypothetical protein
MNRRIKSANPPGRKKHFPTFANQGARGLNSYNSKPAAERWRDIDVVEKIAALFEPDPLVNAQFFDNFRRKTLVEPEKKLMVAILEDGINCFQDHVFAKSAKGKKLFDDAEKWIQEEGGDWIFSFSSVCEFLGLSAEYLRGGLMRWKEKITATHGNGRVWKAIEMAG